MHYTLEKVKPLYIIHYTLYITLFSLFIAGCTSPTEEKTKLATLTGTVHLINDTDNPENDPLDFSDISVALYNLAPLDTTIVRINRQYPHIGVHISQETEFDHRLQNPVRVSQTQPDGTFRIQNISPGKYNLVALKEGWGFRYLYELTITEGENTLIPPDSQFSILNSQFINNNHTSYIVHRTSNEAEQSSAIILYPVRTMPRTIQEPITFQTGKVYLFPENTTVIADVIIENGAVLLINPQRQINFHGNLTCEEYSLRWKITTSEEIYSLEKRSMSEDKWFYKLFWSNQTGANLIVNNGHISFLSDGFELASNNMNVDNMLFHYGGTALISSGVNNTIKNSITRDFHDITHIMYNESEVKYNIMLRNDDNLVTMETDVKVYNNYFIGNRVGIRTVGESISIRNNVFQGNDYGISTVAARPFIGYNNFLGSNRFCIQTQLRYVHQSHAFSDPIINYNNLISVENIIISLFPDNVDDSFQGAVPGVRSDIDATMNFWTAVNPSDFVWDKNDQDELPYECNYEVIISPKSQTRIIEAGIIR